MAQQHPTASCWTISILPTVILTICALSQQAWGLGVEIHGNEEMSLGAFGELNPVANHGGRVYAFWVNGHEGLFYRGDAEALNEVLAAFAAAPLERHEVVVRPGPQTINDFDGDSIPYGWRLDVIGGNPPLMTTLDKGDRFWPRLPVLTICIDGERIKLANLVIPDGVHLMQLSDLRERHHEGLASTDRTVRGWGTGHLSRLDPYDADDARAVAKMLNDKENWVRLNAAGAIARYGATAKPQLPELHESLDRETSEKVKEALAESLATIEDASDDPKQTARHWSLVRAIEGYCRQHVPASGY